MDNEIKNPGNIYRGLPFWSLNGKLEKQELIRQIHIMKEMGFGGFFIHSRAGLVTEYLGEEWMDLVEACVDEACACGMQAWLYDEDRWPSGSCGGIVTAKKTNRMKSISMYLSNYDEFDKDDYGEIIEVFAIKSDGENLVDYQRYSGYETGFDRVTVFVVEEQKGSSFYNGNTFLDTLNRDATEDFLRSTHEKYRERFGERFGSDIFGIFIDEPHRGPLFNGFSYDNENRLAMIPYTYTLFDEFERTHRYDLRERLPELYFRRRDEDESVVVYHYLHTVQNLFINNFAKPYHEWCQKNNLLVTGHVLHENSLSIQTSLCGNVMRYYEHMDYPGIDILGEKNNCEFIVKQCVSVARQLKKEFVLSELYGVTGWQMPLKGFKEIGDWQALYGINLRCPHLSWYTMKGDAKRDCPATILHQSAWHTEFSEVEDYFARLNYALTQGVNVTKTLVINPIESVWLYPKLGWMEHLTLCHDMVSEIEREYSELHDILSDLFVDFDYGDEDIMSRKATVEGGCFVVGAARYDTVILSSNITLRESTVSLLEKFMKNGGRVYIIGTAPSLMDAMPNNRIQNLTKLCTHMPLDRDICRKYLHPDRPFVNAHYKKIGVNIRQVGDKYYIFMLNKDTDTALGEVQFHLNDRYTVTEYSLRSGEILLQERDLSVLKTSFDKGQEHFFIFSDISKKTNLSEYDFKYKLSEPNVLLLDLCNVYCEDGEVLLQQHVLNVDRRLREKLGYEVKGEFCTTTQPWYKEKFCLYSDKEHIIRLEFVFHVEMLCNLQLALEDRAEYEISVNNRHVENVAQGRWIDICYEMVHIPKELLHMGENRLTLSVSFREQMNIESVYLLGDFGVSLQGDKQIMTALPTVLTGDSIAEQGLPFYGGRIIYYLPKTIDIDTVETSEIFGSCINVWNSDEKKLLAFPPYSASIGGRIECLELILTRANTFGVQYTDPMCKIPELYHAKLGDIVGYVNKYVTF